MSRPAAFTAEQKQQALKSILESAAFRRSDQSKALLEYLCQQEQQGRAHAVTEYEIGVQALGRPADFAPETDSSVRTRVHSLRKKLDEYYAVEARAAEFRLEIPKGSYGVRYVVPEPPSKPPTRWKPWLLLGFVAVALVLAWQIRQTPEGERLLRAAWGPMVEPGTEVTIALATPLQLYVRDFGDDPPPTGDPSFRTEIDRTPAFEGWYRQWRNHPLGKTAFLHPNHHSPLWGDASAALVVTQVLAAHGAHIETIPAYRTHAVALRERNAVLVGRPEYSETVSSLMPEGGITVEYNPQHRRLGVHNRSPKKGETEWWYATDNLRLNYGLITVLPTEQAGRRRLIIFSGINSDGSEAGAKFYTSPVGLGELEKHFAGSWPRKFQVVVKTESVDTYTLQTHFEFVRVLE
ncbi:hypothetical protein [uncultured Paludibaculum sp.]|uniref:hypothetical protein n=1 Tax=uncultured Paludibaculum sp. TaxID=1765020 RepID=UPI002AAB4A34|nr:hypothetical protein [uncultured Paludibaculum sp.]